MKKVLLFFPENPLKKDSGNKTRVIQLLEYFKSNNFQVHFVAPKYNDYNLSDIALLEEKFVDKAFIINRKPSKKPILSYLFKTKILSLFTKQSKILNFVTPNFQKEFNIILQNNSYNYIIISYVGWAELINNNRFVKNAKTIIDTHDFATVQAINDKKFNLPKYFETEIKRINYFDEVWAISSDEYFVYSQFAKGKVNLITFSLENKSSKKQVENKWDLIYVASANNHNIKAAKWFFNEVFPLLPSTCKILVIGKIGNFIDNYNNVEKHEFIDDLNQYYANSKIAICPMLSGSGVKIKVIEALSFGLPIVCNTRGVDGLSNKSNNGCLVTDNPTEFVKNITNLMEDKNYYHKISQDAIAFFEANYDTNKGIDNLNKTFDIE